MMCSVTDCSRVSHAKGYCGMHYQRLRQYGSLKRTCDFAYTEEEQFWRRVQKTDNCWLWTGTKVANGYGILSVYRDGRKGSVRAHRLSYEMFVGPIPEGLQLDHLCSVRNCVNPAHLEPVTPMQNIRRGHWRRRTGRTAAPSASLPEGNRGLSA